MLVIPCEEIFKVFHVVFTIVKNEKQPEYTTVRDSVNWHFPTVA